MQMIAVDSNTSVPQEEIFQVWEWADSILKGNAELGTKPVSPEAWREEELVRAAFKQLTEVLEGRAAVRVVDRRVSTCRLEELPAERVELFRTALPQIVKAT
jgi:hypothetical protein